MKTFWSSCSFDDHIIQICYEKYRIDGSLLFPKINIIILLWIGVVFSNGLYFANRVYNDLWVVKVVLLMRVLLALTFIYICYRITTIQQNKNLDENGFHQRVLNTTNIVSCCIVLTSVVNGVMYAWQSSLPGCDESNTEDTWYLYYCNEAYATGGSAYMSSLVLLIGNTYVAAVFRCHHFLAIKVSYVVTMVACIAAALLSPKPHLSTLTLSYSFLLIFMYMNMETNNFLLYSTLLDSEKNKREQANELKHFIGNVSYMLCSAHHSDMFVRCVMTS